jgi:hypothetical protein
MFRVCLVAVLFLSLQSCSLVAQYPVTSASTGVWATTGKGPADHALSKVAGKDCELVRFVGDDSVCQPIKPLPPVEERSIQVRRP